MSAIRLICFGESIDNLKKAIDYKVIGTKRKYNFEKGEQLYFVLKVNKVWCVCARANTNVATDSYPFDDGNSYYPFSINRIETCEPFSIVELCQQYLGPYWGLKLQQPTIIDSENFLAAIKERFKPIEYNLLMEKIRQES